MDFKEKELLDKIIEIHQKIDDLKEDEKALKKKYADKGVDVKGVTKAYKVVYSLVKEMKRIKKLKEEESFVNSQKSKKSKKTKEHKEKIENLEMPKIPETIIIPKESLISNDEEIENNEESKNIENNEIIEESKDIQESKNIENNEIIEESENIENSDYGREISLDDIDLEDNEIIEETENNKIIEESKDIQESQEIEEIENNEEISIDDINLDLEDNKDIQETKDNEVIEDIQKSEEIENNEVIEDSKDSNDIENNEDEEIKYKKAIEVVRKTGDIKKLEELGVSIKSLKELYTKEELDEIMTKYDTPEWFENDFVNIAMPKYTREFCLNHLEEKTLFNKEDLNDFIDGKYEKLIKQSLESQIDRYNNTSDDFAYILLCKFKGSRKTPETLVRLLTLEKYNSKYEKINEIFRMGVSMNDIKIKQSAQFSYEELKKSFIGIMKEMIFENL